MDHAYQTHNVVSSYYKLESALRQVLHVHAKKPKSEDSGDPLLVVLARNSGGHLMGSLLENLTNKQAEKFDGLINQISDGE